MDHDPEIYVGLCRTAGGVAARYVAIDEIGLLLHEGQLAWSASELRRWLERIGSACRDVRVVLGMAVEETAAGDEATCAVMRVLRESGMPVLLVEEWMLESLWRSHKRRRQTHATRARCLAQVLLVTSCPPRHLAPRERSAPMTAAASTEATHR